MKCNAYCSSNIVSLFSFVALVKQIVKIFTGFKKRYF
jgi:hypothetical protein